MMSLVKKALIAASVLFCLQTYAATEPTQPTTTTPTPATDISNMSAAQRAQIEEVVHQYLLKKPEVLIEAMQILQQRQYKETEQTVKQTQQTASQFANALFHQSNDPVAGNPNGKVTIVEFFDYQCPHCVDMAPVISDIIKANPDVRIVFKEFPIRGPASELASRAALAANKQGKYVVFSHALLAAKQPITEALIMKVAQEQGLDTTQLKKDMNDATVSDQLKSNTKLAQSLKLFGTPAFFIGKTDASASDNINYFPGRITQTQLQDAINQTKS